MPFPCPDGHSGPLHPKVTELEDLLTGLGRRQSLNDAVQAAVDEGLSELADWKIFNGDDFLQYASCLLKTWVPSENSTSTFIYHVLTVFHYIFDHPEMNDLQTPVTPASIGPDGGPVMTPISKWIVEFSIAMGDWLAKPESLTPESYQSFKDAEKYRLEKDYLIPKPDDPVGGFSCFNELFARKLRQPYPYADVRPIDSPEEPNVVIFPADSTFDGSWSVDNRDVVTIKSLPWPISALLKGSNPAYIERFHDGVWCHAFLNTFDYHRQHAPVAGIVVESYIIQGLNYIEVEKKDDEDGNTKLHLGRSHKADTDAPDNAGYEFIQARGCVIIDTGAENGLVAVLPIGMAQVSPVKLSVKRGDTVRKGDEISWFEFGGSDIVLVFEKAAGAKHFAPRDVHHLMGQQLCRLHLDF